MDEQNDWDDYGASGHYTSGNMLDALTKLVDEHGRDVPIGYSYDMGFAVGRHIDGIYVWTDDEGSKQAEIVLP